MLLTPENTKGKNVAVHDNVGRIVKGVLSYDTETKEAELIVLNAFFLADPTTPMPVSIASEDDINKGELLIVKTTLLGSHATIDGEKV